MTEWRWTKSDTGIQAREISQSATDEPQNDRANPPSFKVAGSGLSQYGSEINSDNATHR